MNNKHRFINLKTLALITLFFIGLSLQAETVFVWHSGAMNALVPVHALQKSGIEKMDQKGVVHYGTSSGAIVAALLADGKTTSEVKEFFENFGASVFGLDKIIAGAMGRHEEASDALKTKLFQIFETKTLKNLPNLHIFAAEITGKVIDLSQEPGFGDVMVFEALMASISIPQIFGQQAINGRQFFDAGAAPIFMNDPSRIVLDEQKGMDENMVFSMANGFRAPIEVSADNYSLLIAPATATEMDTVPLEESGQMIADHIIKIQPTLGFLLAIFNTTQLTGQQIFTNFGPLLKNLNIDKEILYAAMTNKAALQAFARLGQKMADDNADNLGLIAGLLSSAE